MPACGSSGPGISNTKMPRSCCLMGELHQSMESMQGEDSAGPAVRDDAASPHPERQASTPDILHKLKYVFQWKGAMDA